MNMTEHEAGYRDFSNDPDGAIARAVADHFKGVPFLRSDDWFSGYQDAADDKAMCNAPMYA